MADLSPKRQAFVEAYLQCWNGSEAARRAGYNGESSVTGSRLLANVKIKAEIDKRLRQKAMTADEVLGRLRAQATADMREFMRDDGLPGIDLEKAKAAGATHLIKKLTFSKGRVQVELYDSQKALELLAKHLNLLTDRVSIEADEKLLGLLRGWTAPTADQVESEPLDQGEDEP